MPIPYSFIFYTSAIDSNVWTNKSSLLVLLLQNCLGCFRTFTLSPDFRTYPPTFFSSLYWICYNIASVLCFGFFFFVFFVFFGHEACGILAPRPGIKPVPPALEGEVLTTGLPGKSLEPTLLTDRPRDVKWQTPSQKGFNRHGPFPRFPGIQGSVGVGMMGGGGGLCIPILVGHQGDTSAC